MIGGLLLLLAACVVWGPDLGQVPNSGCYLLDHEMRQARPCKPEERR